MTTATRTVDVTTPDLTIELADGTEVPALTTAELAVLVGVTPRSLRRAFRAAGRGVGRGSIYATTPGDAQSIVDSLR